jgi:hypothetical protein
LPALLANWGNVIAICNDGFVTQEVLQEKNICLDPLDAEFTQCPVRQRQNLGIAARGHTRDDFREQLLAIQIGGCPSPAQRACFVRFAEMERLCIILRKNGNHLSEK